MQATIAAEDERFYEHPGVDTTALLRAVLQNLQAVDVVSGASTITMQLCYAGWLTTARAHSRQS